MKASQGFGRSRFEFGLPPSELWGVATKEPTHKKVRMKNRQGELVTRLIPISNGEKA